MDNTNNILVTGPINKETISASGTDFSGHTEFLAEHAKIVSPLMLMANEKIKIGLATTHVPIKKVKREHYWRLNLQQIKSFMFGSKETY